MHSCMVAGGAILELQFISVTVERPFKAQGRGFKAKPQRAAALLRVWSCRGANTQPLLTPRSAHPRGNQMPGPRP